MWVDKRLTTATKIVTVQCIILCLGFIVFLASIIGLVYAASQLFSGGDVHERDILLAINSTSSALYDTIWTVLTHLGGFVAILLAATAMVVYFYRAGNSNSLLVTLFGVGGASLLNVTLKSIFERDRPYLWERLVVESSYSFPSGHAMASASLSMVLIVLLWNTRWRWWSVVAASVFITAIGYSRLYLGVHYPTDIVAGWLISTAWVAVVVLIIQRTYNRSK